jgi:hypothetical protein
MNIPRLLALLLLAPASAAAAQHSLVVRVSQGLKSYSHTVKSAAGAQTNFVGKVNGQDMIVNVIFGETKGSYLAQYQLEVSRPDRSHTFQAQSAVRLASGDRLTAVECGEWKVDLALDTAIGGPMPAWNPAGGNHRLTAFAGKTRCRVLQEAGSQSNIIEGSTSGGRRSDFRLNGVVSQPEGNACKVQYQIESSALKLQGEETLVLGKKTAARGGKASLLVEGPAEAPRAPAPAAAPGVFTAPPGGVPLLR